MKKLVSMIFSFLLAGCLPAFSPVNPFELVKAINEEKRQISEDPCIKKHWDERAECRKSRQKEVDEMAEAMKKTR